MIPQHSARKVHQILKRLLLLFLWTIATSTTISAIVAPYLEYHRILCAQNIYHFLHFFCHQIPSRCFWIYDSNMGLCSRCFSIYASFSFCIIILFCLRFYRTLKKSFMLYLGIVLIIPCLADGTLSTVTNYISSSLTRSITGFLCGTGFGLISLITKKGGK
ncbi:MAG TPA: DUF2085 domain-containing protein [Candidatus Brocadiia bacterium]